MKRIFLLLGAFAATLTLASCGNRVISYLPPSPNDVIHHDIKKPGDENKDETPVEPQVVMYKVSVYNGDTLLLEKEYKEGSEVNCDEFDSYFDKSTLKENEVFWGFRTEDYIGLFQDDGQTLIMDKDIKLVPYIRIKYGDNNKEYGLTDYYNNVFAPGAEVKYESARFEGSVDLSEYKFNEEILVEKPCTDRLKDQFMFTVREYFMNPIKYITFEATPFEGGVIVKVLNVIQGVTKYAEFTENRIRVIDPLMDRETGTIICVDYTSYTRLS